MKEYIVAKNQKVHRQDIDWEHHYSQEVEREKERVRRKLVYAIAMLAAVYVIAIVAFHLAEGWSWEDSIYFTTSTITTVGYGDLVPHSYYGRLLAIPLMWIGIAVGLYAIYSIQDYGRANLDRVAEHVENIRKRHLGKK